MVKITTGPSAGLTIEGQCECCDGITDVDTVGVIEFDTDTDKVVETHRMKDDTTGYPYASPDGRFILMVGKNGGEVLRILRTAENGSPSTFAWNVFLEFDQPVCDTVVFNDFAFIQTDEGNPDDGIKRDMIVVGSGTDNKVAVLDLLKMVNNKPKVTIVTLSSNQTLTSKKGRRQIEWIPSTKYVWLDGESSHEVYVLDVDKKKIVNTVTDVLTEKLVAVENYEHKRTVSLIKSQIAATFSELSNGCVDNEIFTFTTKDGLSKPCRWLRNKNRKESYCKTRDEPTGMKIKFQCRKSCEDFLKDCSATPE